MAKDWVIRDPIHGYVEPTDQEMKVLDSPAVQRLRRIKQLANTFLVFPGAVHTRFEHSLGTLHMAHLMAKRIPRLFADKSAVKQVRLAALLHDVGHGPFSHVSEEIMRRVIGLEEFDNVSIALDIIELDDPIRSSLGNDVDPVLQLLRKGDETTLERDIVDGDLDADKLDYLLRDSHYAGVPYGHADTLHILYTLREIRSATGESYLGLSQKGTVAVLGLKLARFHMHSVVYNHKVRRIADAMLVRATLSSIEEERIDPGYFEYSEGDADFLQRYLDLDDRSLMDMVIDAGGSPSDLMQRLGQRKLLKKAYERDISEFVGLQRRHVQRLDLEQTAQLEAEIADDAGADPSRIIVDRQTIDNPTYRPPVGVTAERRILIEADPQPKFLDEMTGPWSSETKHIEKVWVFSEDEHKEKVGKIAQRVFEEA